VSIDDVFWNAKMCLCLCLESSLEYRNLGIAQNLNWVAEFFSFSLLHIHSRNWISFWE
jgi:hypothetical protein